MIKRYPSISGNAELELAAANHQCCTLSVFPLVPEAAKWNGVALNVAAARRLATDILAWLDNADERDVAVNALDIARAALSQVNSLAKDGSVQGSHEGGGASA